MRNYLLSSLVLILSTGIISVANAQAVPGFDPSTQTTSTRTAVAVDVDVANVTDVYGYQFDLNYNPNVLQAMSSTEGSLLTNGGSTFFISGSNGNVARSDSAIADL